MADNQNPEQMILKEEDNTTPEQFREAVSAAWRQAWGAVKQITIKNPAKADPFWKVGQIIVQQLQQW